MNKNKIRFWLNVALITLLVLTMVSLVGGHRSRAASQVWGMIHSVSGALLLVGCAAHAFSHRDWFRAVVLRKPNQPGERTRACRLVNMWLIGVSIVCGASGLFNWDPLHLVSGAIMFLSMAVHLALHRQWMAANARRCLGIESDEKQSQLKARGELG